MSAFRRSLTAVAVTASALAMLTPGASATTSRPKVVAVAHDSGPTPTMAAGLIVKTTTATPSSGLVRAAERALPHGLGVGRVTKSASGGRTSVLPTSQRMTASVAEAVAAKLRTRPDVVWAAPNYILRAFADPPVPVTDTYFVQDRARQVWDWRASTDTKVRSVLGSTNTFGNGGFSSRAPYAWKSTQGNGAVVAVLDTGITTHPDLPTWNGSTNTAGDRMLPGYDFVSRYVPSEDTGRDGNGWDDNPQDQGDWEDAGYCDADSPGFDSSWHGTHVAGIIAGQANNGGVVGVAPQASILPVRVLGLCGGSFDDFVAAMRWSVGLSVVDPLTGDPVPVNPHPADVLNMSLGGYFPCTTTDAQPMLDAIAAVRATGAVIVASAGNDNLNIATHPVVPASCPGVVAVGATSEYGDRAGYLNANGTKSVYSNYGSAVDVVAPGGDEYWSSTGGILSTINAGLTSPVDGGTYARYSGTSMAAPVVAAAAALLKSSDHDLTAVETEAALEASVRPFPVGRATQFKPCSTSICGKGIIDLSKPQVPSSPTTVSGTPTIGEPLTAVSGAWSRVPSSFTYQWFRDGSAIAGATSQTYFPTHDDVGHALSVRMSPATTAYSMFGSTSAATDPVPDGPEVTLTDLATAAKYGIAGSATVTVAGVPADSPVELRRGSAVIASGTTDVNGVAHLVIPGTAWAIGANQIRAAYTGATPASSAGIIVTAAKASSSITISVPRSVKHTVHAKVTATVVATGHVTVAGSLYVYDGSKHIMTATLSSTAGGKRTFTLPLLKAGKHYITVRYGGSSTVTGKTSSRKVIASY